MSWLGPHLAGKPTRGGRVSLQWGTRGRGLWGSRLVSAERSSTNSRGAELPARAFLPHLSRAMGIGLGMGTGPTLDRPQVQHQGPDVLHK